MKPTAARWAFDRFASVDWERPRWNGAAAADAMRCHLVALGLPEPSWVRVVSGPGKGTRGDRQAQP